MKIKEILTPEHNSELKLPLFLESVSAGFPSPAQDYLEQKLDLNDYLIRNPSATFFVRVTGDSMIDAGINSEDILVVDRSLTPKDNNIIIAVIDSEMLVKRLSMLKDKVFLLPDNENYQPIEIKPEMRFVCWGVVTTVIHSVL